jgi:hypothetical protein
VTETPFQFRDSYFAAAEQRSVLIPATAEALNREGRRLRERGEISAAIAKHQAALRLKGDAASTHQNLALAWWRRGNLPEALAAYRRVMELRPNSAAAHSDYIYAMYHDPAATGETLLRETSRWVSEFAISCQLPVISCQSEGGGLRLNPEPRTPARRDRPLNPRLRVGYVSADFRRHTLRHFIAPLLAHHDRQVVEVFCYSNVSAPDRVTELLRPLAERWREVKGMKAAELAELIRRDGIDILVDLSGHMGGNRLTTFTLKPAPVQVQIYFAGSSGLPQMDYRVTDGYSDPFDCAQGRPMADRNAHDTPHFPRRAFCRKLLASLLLTGAQGMEATTIGFAQEHFGAAQLGDVRRTQRLVKIADRIIAHPGGTLPQKMASPADLKALYRLLDCQQVTHASVMQTHRQLTLSRMAQCQQVVLLIHDTTQLDYTGKQKSLTKLGQIAKGFHRGYLCHNTLAVVADGPVIGLASQILHVRPKVPKKEARKKRQQRLSRETRLWKRGSEAVGPPPPGRLWVDICDRGADLFEYLDHKQDGT